MAEELYQCPPYTATVLLRNDVDINKDCPRMYTQSWSATLHDVIHNFCRNNGILEACNQVIPKAMFDVIAFHYSNDITKSKSFDDYINGLRICKYMSSLKHTKKQNLTKDNDLSIKQKYKLSKKAAFPMTKVFKALKDYNAEPFEINVKNNLEIIFIDHELNKCNLKKYSYPKDIAYTLSEQERRIIASIRDTIEVNKVPHYIDGHVMTFQTNELHEILKKGNFKSGKESIRLHTIIEYRNKALFAMDYSFTYLYFMFVFKYFTIIIHDQVSIQNHVTRTMEAKVIANRYRGILKEFDDSGL
eukprot:357139_1